MIKYPTGVEVHGENLRIWFMYQGKRIRENLGVPDTAKNRKIAGELRSSVCYAIKVGNFDYANQFPNSPNLSKFTKAKKEITINELANNWLSLKKMEVARSTITKYKHYLTTCITFIGFDRNIKSITKEDILILRKNLLTGLQSYEKNSLRKIKTGRTVRTVNVYMVCLNGLFEFARDSGYIDNSPMLGISPLKKTKIDPNPLTKDEYNRILNVCDNIQIKNLVILAVNTGMRHGVLSALSWEDIDTKNWTINVCRNLSMRNHFTPPKTEKGNRIINLTIPAIQAIKDQMLYTKMGKTHQIDVHLREYGRTRVDKCTFVFTPDKSVNFRSGDWFSQGAYFAIWNRLLKKASIRYRTPYQTRHTFACWALSAGANPSFIASQMGHTSAQMVYSVYGKWMSDNNEDQLTILNKNFINNVPLMPQSNKSKKQIC